MRKTEPLMACIGLSRLWRDAGYDSGNLEWGGVARQLFEFGGSMDDLVNSTERFNGSLPQPVLLIIEPLTLTRTSILSILRRELPEFEIIEMATMDGLD